MGLFDVFIPDPAIPCPKCGGSLQDWQGKHEDNCLLVWKQGLIDPIDQQCDEEQKVPIDTLKGARLPKEFYFYGGECRVCNYELPISQYGCVGVCVDDVWRVTKIEPEPVRATLLKDKRIVCEECSEAWETETDRVLDICPRCESLVKVHRGGQS